MSGRVVLAALVATVANAAIVADARWNARFSLIDARDSRRSFTEWGGHDPLAGATHKPRQRDGDAAVWECLGQQQPPAGTPPPYAELFAHFRQVFDATAPFRALQWHAYGGNDHRGPWLENYWMRSFLRRPYAWWYPYVPVFIQLTDASAHGYHGPARRWLEETLRDIHWRRDVVYVIVTQYDTGPLAIVPDPAFFKNFLVFSAGGWGNVPLPLLNGRVMRQHSSSPPTVLQPFPLPATRVLSFAGRATYAYQAGIPEQYHVLRVSALASLQERLPRGVLTVQDWQPTDAWLQLTSESLLTLAFRGYGATSFRLYEALHLGSVPVYVWSNLLWLPYRHARERLWGPGGVAFVVEASDLGRWVDHDLCRLLLDGSEPVREANVCRATGDGGMPPVEALAAAGAFSSTSNSTVARMRQRLGEMVGGGGGSVLQRYFTFEAVMRHVQDFLVHPGRSELACERKPEVRNE